MFGFVVTDPKHASEATKVRFKKKKKKKKEVSLVKY